MPRREPRPELPPDPEALEMWRQLPQNKPSRQALPPAAGGLGWSRALTGGLLFLILLLVLLGWLAQGPG